ncbi:MULTISPECIES: primase-helicase family protein [unclassified Arenibacter]|uniref:primase-helicase family protein n=1 Tax=unclassified Arenibacter TaxID=2615047 RepID=UPI000E343809|nr:MULTISPECIES: primase-helicase family protein [unclassified Arenibacter]MCM4162988.1 helicase [Arenibacter sp. A80]RFT57027.1 helicase [Arenibacter sp. P308M17]
MKKSSYLRIGTEYYKHGEVPLHSGDTYKTLLKWRKSEIITDEGKEFLNTIEKYDGFCLIPSHTEYQRCIKNFYNKYEKLEHKFEPGDFPMTKVFLIHIFGEQYELGMDYLTILWRYPTQILPILCLVSEERKTGKTTFLNWLKLIFQGNMTINKNEDFRSRFNSDWADKLIVSVDEVLLDKKEDSERIKNLSTAVTYKTESKGVDKVESYFFGKFILCSNNEDNFIQIDSSEIRYWIRKVPALKDEGENPDLMQDLKMELPFFMHYLNHREIISKRHTRMWFTKELIYTEALGRLVSGNRTFVNREIEEILLDDFIKFEAEVLKYSLSDLVEKLSKNNIKVSSTKVSEVLRTNFGLESKNGSYNKFYLALTPNGNTYMVQETKQKGRYYTFLKEDYMDSTI